MGRRRGGVAGAGAGIVLVALLASGVAAATGAPSVGAPGSGTAVPAAKRELLRSVRETPGTRVSADRLRELRGRRVITATVLLNGSSVSDEVALARAVGSDLSKEQRKGRRAAIAGVQRPVISRIRLSGVRVIAEMQDAVNGVVVSGTRAQVEALASLPGVLSVTPSRIHRRLNGNSNVFTGVPAAWEGLGYTGEGQVIAVIDTGIDYTHTNFGGSGNLSDYTDNDPTRADDVPIATPKIIKGFDLVGDYYDAGSDILEQLIPQPDPDPLPCDGHGTHVAGTVAGYGVRDDGSTFTGPYTAAGVDGLRIAPGVAPAASIIDIKVFGCDGSVDDAVEVAAIDLAVREGASVISMSIGAPYGTNRDPVVRAINNAARAGVLPVIAAGNDTWSPYLVATPASADRALAVAAMDAAPSVPTASVSATSGVVSVQNSNLVSPLAVTGDVVVAPADSGIGLACDVDALPNLTGKVLIAVRGGCDRVAKAQHGQAKGAVAVIMVNNESGLPPLEGPIDGVSIPFLGASGNDEAALVAMAGLSASIVAAGTAPNPGYASAASFTSGGPRNGDSAFKPDLAAPGVNVISAGMGTGSSIALLSGTSMATPHAAGIAALVRQAHPSWTVSQVKAALMNTARHDQLSAFDMRVLGTGVVSAPDALQATAVATTADGTNALSFGYQSADGRIAEEREFRITNLSDRSLTYALVPQSIGDQPYAQPRITPSSVTLRPGQHRTVRVQISFSRSAVALLPGIASGEAGRDGLTVVRGLILALPVGAGAPASTLHIPYLMVPRGESRIETGGLRASSTPRRPDSSWEITVRNRGIHAGAADVYAWQLQDRRGDAPERTDILSVGIQTFADYPTAGDAYSVVAVGFRGMRSTAADREVDVAIDVTGDDDPEYFLVGVDSGLVLDGYPNGQWATHVLDAATGDVVAVYDGSAPVNSSVVLMPFLASDLGLAPGTSSIRYSVVAYDLTSVGEDSVDRWAEWDVMNPVADTGQWVDLAPRSSDVILLAAGAAVAAVPDVPLRPRRPQLLGWLVVSLDDRSGPSQVDTVALRR